MFKKRIAFMISKQHLIPHGGIGQFAKGFSEMGTDLDYMIDIITDHPVDKNSEFISSMSKMRNVRFVDPGLNSQGNHRAIHAFSESLNFNQIVAFRDSVFSAMTHNLYDAIVVNTPEAFFAVYALGIQEYVNIIFYTHNENLVFKNNTFSGIFNSSYDAMISSAISVDNIIVGTQTLRNVLELKLPTARFLPMPIPERDLLTANHETGRDGVLFIGRWEERKQPTEFIKIIKETGLRALVMTNAMGMKKFSSALNEIGAKYDIRQSITGQEKVDFIKSAKVFFMPSKSESFGFAMMEAMGHLHPVVLSGYDWITNFDTDFINVVTRDSAASEIKKLHDGTNVPDSNLKYVKSLDEGCSKAWQDVIENFKQKESKSNAASVLKSDNFFYSDFIESLDRKIGIEDIISVLANRKKYKIAYDTENTYLSITDSKIPKHKNGSVNEFFG